MVPDVKMRDVKIHYNLAFPLAQGSIKEGVLTKEYFEDDHQEDLLKALGLLPDEESSQPTPAMQDTYKRLVCRYLGPHSQVPSKSASESFRRGLSTLQLAQRGTEGCLEAQTTVSEAQTTESEAQVSKAKETAVKVLPHNEKKAVYSNRLMRQIRSAKENKNFLVKFQKENPNIQLKDIKVGRNRYLIHVPSGKIPLFGSEVLKAVVEAIDEELAHQGEQVIIDTLNRKRYILFDDKEDMFNISKIEMFVRDHVDSCCDCKEVKSIKDLISPNQGTLLSIPDDVVPRVLAYADRKHV